MQKISKKIDKAQSGLEYMMTYGWALIAVATIVGFLIFASGGGVNQNTCTSFLTLVCKGVGADGDTLILVLQNSTGQKITINPLMDIAFDSEEGYAKIIYEGRTYWFDDVEIGAGTEFKIEGAGMANAEEISITYTEKSTGLKRTVTSSISTDALDDVEINNYVASAEPLATTTIGATPQVITFGTLTEPDGDEAAGDWEATDSVLLAFYVESYTPGTTAEVVFVVSPVTVTLEDGWNYAEIELMNPELLPDLGSGADIPDFTIQSNLGDFDISDTPPTQPRAILTAYPLS